MIPRAVLLRRLPLPVHVHRLPRRLVAAYSTPSPSSSSSPSQPLASSTSTPNTTPASPQKSWLTRRIESSPTAKRAFLAIAKALGYGSPRQLAARRAFVLYEQVCARMPDEGERYWKEACHLPPTFQSFFTITNLHIWLLTTRLRALPAPHGTFYVQALIDHFFLDVEDRVRDVLQPKETPSAPYTFRSSFYTNPNDLSSSSSSSSSSTSSDGEGGGKVGLVKKARVRAPDRIVTRQMKIFKEQWAGMGLSFDLAMCMGDEELASAIWRNLLGARGANGIEYPDADTQARAGRKFRRAVNLVGGEVVDIKKIDLEKEATTDDNSGVSDFPPEEVDKYLSYPEVMSDLTRYIRRELARLEKVSDEDIMNGDWTVLKFGPVRKES